MAYNDENNSSMFEDEDNMVIPDDITDINGSKVGYLGSTGKMVFIFIGLVPIVILPLLLYNYFNSISLAIVMTILYTLVYIWGVRMYVIEEPKQKESLEDLEDNRYSGLPFIWKVERIIENGEDNGLIYLKQEDLKLQRALVIKFDSHSIIGTSEDFLFKYRESLQEFLRELRMDFRWYKIQKKPELSPALIAQSNNIKNIKSVALSKLVKIQLNEQVRYTLNAEQRYMDYIMIINDDFTTIRNFKRIINDVLNRTLKEEGFFRDIEILDKAGVDDFLSLYYMQDTINSSAVSITNRAKPFSNYAEITEVIDEQGYVVDVETLDFIATKMDNLQRGISVEDVINKDDDRERRLSEKREFEKANATKINNKKRINQEITNAEYEKEKARIEKDYSVEGYNPNAEAEKRQAEREALRQAKIAEREAKRKPVEVVEDKKWFEDADFKNDVEHIESANKVEVSTYEDVSLGEFFDEIEEDVSENVEEHSDYSHNTQSQEPKYEERILSGEDEESDLADIFEDDNK